MTGPSAAAQPGRTARPHTSRHEQPPTHRRSVTVDEATRYAGGVSLAAALGAILLSLKSSQLSVRGNTAARSVSRLGPPHHATGFDNAA